ncbi:MAG: hypothetical protein JW395_3679 [Nitrospira sp.]|nr:hypothetical protein [Nitrospira sp.]
MNRDGSGRLVIHGAAIQSQQGARDLGRNPRHQQMPKLGQQFAREPHNLLWGFAVTEDDGRKPLPSGPQHTE